MGFSSVELSGTPAEITKILSESISVLAYSELEVDLSLASHSAMKYGWLRIELPNACSDQCFYQALSWGFVCNANYKPNHGTCHRVSRHQGGYCGNLFRKP